MVVPAAKPPQPAVALTVKVVAVAVAVPPVVGVTVTNPNGGLVTVSTVNGVPSVAADVTDTTVDAPGTHVATPVFAQVSATDVGAVTNADAVEVTVEVIAAVTSATVAALN